MELRDLPKVDTLANAAPLAEFPPRIRTEAARAAIDAMRSALTEGRDVPDGLEFAMTHARGASDLSLRPAVNLSGVVLHTGLGRARLAPSVATHVAEVAAGYSTLELDLESGERGDRQEHVRDLLRKLTGAEDAFVVNNAAAGVMLTLAAAARGGEVVLSRGQMVEIGGSFRMPDIIRESGCRLVEVGCTNRTHLSDYLAAMGDDTSAILRCHPSNYAIVGFTSEPSLSELAALAKERGVVLIDDQGSGLLVDARTLGLPRLPTLPESAAFADVSIASGDKLLGGPQAGIIVGRSELIREISRHPLARAFRIDKLSLAALEATLRLWASGREEEIPTIRYLRRPLAEVRADAERLLAAWGGGAEVSEGLTEAGSGSAPGAGVPTFRVGLSGGAEALARALRLGMPPMVARIEKDRVWLDPRTLDADELPIVEARLRELSG
ncbi:L-seryl-tRNA(Sec) selenium transferase [Fimbriimonas ginsengisoli]|uniref:L-seryl-tRNA(Sec) selenium transferase n=1 Tax=Fimbriimonas ginsengisoli Gsoil 348 TaxID=661478 RepID=A0A068NWT2_FIMGI|nr:L-seryl-tRNA(Sec) selenium transferase [Fimbriimonas ginsengisoli]AIE87832.1 L-seryl-tRNA selenium transferase [Fimbriimonas ginsengisoli Gsoil 348]